MTSSSVDRMALDSFPYRHRVSDLMRAPLVTLGAEIPMDEAARWMVDAGVSSVVVLDENQAPVSILTERDLLRAVADDGAKALAAPLKVYASAPVATIRAEAFIYVALGRMSRLKIRHLVCVNARGHAVGMLTAGAMLAQRAGDTLRLGDQIADAAGAEDLAKVIAALPDLCEQLRETDVPALTISAVLTGIFRDTCRRACRVTEAAMADDPAHGPAPVPFSVMALGALGREESLLAPASRLALVYDDGAGPSDKTAAWFQTFGERVTDMLAKTGLSPCPDGISIARDDWRMGLSQWESRVRGWCQNPAQALDQQADLFFDMVMVHGDIGVTGRLRRFALGLARRAVPFLDALVERMDHGHGGLNFFGSLKKGQDDRLELCRHAMSPIVQGGRVLGLHLGVAATHSLDRWESACDHGGLSEEMMEELEAAQEVLTSLLLRQQLQDLRNGQAASYRIDCESLSEAERSEVKGIFRLVDRLGGEVRRQLAHMVSAGD